METSTSMLQFAAMQGMILVQQIKGCFQLIVLLAVDISLNHGDTPCKRKFLLCAFLLLLATLHCKQKHYLCCSLNRH